MGGPNYVISYESVINYNLVTKLLMQSISIH